MKSAGWSRTGAIAIAIFFVVGSMINIAAPSGVAQDYARWGYPTWFHYVTGTLELTTAALLARHQTRPFGILLGMGLMGAAATTVLVNGQVLRAAAPVVILGLLLALGMSLLRRR